MKNLRLKKEKKKTQKFLAPKINVFIVVLQNKRQNCFTVFRIVFFEFLQVEFMVM